MLLVTLSGIFHISSLLSYYTASLAKMCFRLSYMLTDPDRLTHFLRTLARKETWVSYFFKIGFIALRFTNVYMKFSFLFTPLALSRVHCNFDNWVFTLCAQNNGSALGVKLPSEKRISFPVGKLCSCNLQIDWMRRDPYIGHAGGIVSKGKQSDRHFPTHILLSVLQKSAPVINVTFIQNEEGIYRPCWTYGSLEWT